MKKLIALFLILISLFLVTSCEYLPSFDADNIGSENIGNQDNNKTPDHSADDKQDSEGSLDNFPDDTDKENLLVYGYFAYQLSDGKAEIVKYNGNENVIFIPEVIDGCPVVAVKSGAFVNEATARSGGSTTLQSPCTIYIPDGIETIESNSFTQSGNVYITSHSKKPDGWKDNSFNGSASDNNNENGNTYYETPKKDCVIKEGMVFLYNRHMKGYFVVDCFSNAKKITIPDEIDGLPVNNIGNAAFSDCTNLAEITLSKHTTYIYHRAFMRCISLKIVNFNTQKLAKILANSFAFCTSLEKVVLPESNFYIQNTAFANCGNINELYVPAGMATIGSTAFTGTSIGQIYYASSESDFYKISGYQNLLNITQSSIIFGEKTIIDGISSIPAVKETQLGVSVTVRGYVANYCDRGDSFILVDENNENGILVSIRSNDPIEVFPAFGQHVEIVGSVSRYDGEFCVSNIESITVVGESKEIEPLKLSIEEMNENTEEYLYRYIEFSGTVEYIETYYTFVEGLSVVMFSRAIANPMKVGDNITVRCTIGYFGTVYEIQYSYLDVEIENANTDITEATVTEAKTLDIGSCVTVRGYVAVYYQNNAFLLVNEENTDGIVVFLYNTSYVYLPECGDIIEVTGSIALFNGLYEIVNITNINKIGYGEIAPIPLSPDDYKNYEDYAYRYIEFESYVSGISPSYVSFGNVPINLYNPEGNTFSVLDMVRFRGTILPYKNVYQLRALPENMLVIGSVLVEN